MKGLGKRVACAILASLLSASLTACSGTSGAVTPGRAQTSTLGAERAPAAGIDDFADSDADVVNVAGTYTGTITEVESGHTRSGTLTITISQSGKKISGPFEVTFGSQVDDLTLAGKVKGRKKAHLTFTVTGKDARAAYFTAKLIGSTLKGTGNVPASGSKPEVSLKIDATRESSG